MDIVCRRHKISWYVVGDFVRNVLSGTHNPNGTLHVAFMPFQLTSLLRDFETLGLIHDTDYTKLTETMCVTRSTMALSLQSEMHMCTFEVQLTGLHSISKVVASDAIALTSSGLVLLEQDALLDYLNGVRGIGLLDRLIDLSVRQVGLTKPLINFVDYNMENAGVLRTLDKVISEDIHVKGVKCTSTTTECPVCMDTKTLITLRCKHSFCGKCMAKHIELSDLNGGEGPRCPLCRGTMHF